MSKHSSGSVIALSMEESRQVTGGDDIDICALVYCGPIMFAMFIREFISQPTEGTWADWHG
ncbi:MAG: hypothetical protein IRZ00_14790 [Gemmatimonadetes bacterium]|nr:hypothetical protein [Gemmatimonadota bacterium]